MTARVAELERQLGLNRRNSGKPPSSEGRKQPPRTTRWREPAGQKPGGPPGHRGERLRPVAAPTRILEHYPACGERCGSSLPQDAATSYRARQVFALPAPPPLVVTAHRAHCGHGAQGGTSTPAAFPAGLTAPGQDGARIAAFVVELLQGQLLPEDRRVELRADLLGVKPAAATRARLSARGAQRFQGLGTVLCQVVKRAAVKPLDETGLRIGGQPRW